MKFSKHARQRMRERGIDKITVIITVDEGRVVCQGDGDLVYKKDDISVVMEQDGDTVITVFKGKRWVQETI